MIIATVAVALVLATRFYQTQIEIIFAHSVNEFHQATVITED